MIFDVLILLQSSLRGQTWQPWVPGHFGGIMSAEPAQA